MKRLEEPPAKRCRESSNDTALTAQIPPPPPPPPPEINSEAHHVSCMRPTLFKDCCFALGERRRKINNYLEPSPRPLQNGEVMPQFEDYISSSYCLAASSIVLRGKMLGHGATGQVRAGFVRARPAAIKIIELGKHPEPAHLIRDVRAEISIMTRLQHSHIVIFFGVATRKTQVLIAMERCLGSLQDLIITGTLFTAKEKAMHQYFGDTSETNMFATGSFFSPKRKQQMKGQRFPDVSKRMCLDVAIQVADGMAFLHANFIIHRDIKPENILVSSLDQEQQVCHVKIADFGLSTLKRAVLVSNLTLTARVGTPLYMAPELMTTGRSAKYGPQADIYSWAMLTWAIFARQRPFVGPRYDSLTAPGVMDLIKRGERPRFEGLGISPALRSLIQEAWHPTPRLRPRSFIHVLEGIANLRSDQSIQKESNSLRHRSNQSHEDQCSSGVLRSSNATLDRDSSLYQKSLDDLLDYEDCDLLSTNSKDLSLEDKVLEDERRRRVTDGAQQLRRLQELDLERRQAIDAASSGRLEALVGWVINIPEVTDRGAVIGIVKHSLLVRLEDTSERLIRPLLHRDVKKKKRTPLQHILPRSSSLRKRKQCSDVDITTAETKKLYPFTLVEKIRFV